MKFGFDYHGVLDAHWELYAAMTSALVAAGHEVHIITGHQEDQVKSEVLLGLGIRWTHWFSIVDYHLELGEHKVTFDENERPWMLTEVWDRAKAEYCAREKIDFMVDDSPVYGSYFTGQTVYCLQKNYSAQEIWMRLAGRI